MAIQVFTDGGSRGNPGSAACAFVVFDNDKEVYKSSKFLGTATNNYAEYSGLIFALEWLIKSNYAKSESLSIIMDSELVVRQMNKIYKVKHPEIRILYDKATSLLKGFKGKVSFESVVRSKNKVADSLVNEELDRV